MAHYREITCNKCNKTHTEKGLDMFEYQEFMKFETVGGYGSVWGDGTRISLDLCQTCQHELFKDYVVEIKSLG